MSGQYLPGGNNYQGERLSSSFRSTCSLREIHHGRAAKVRTEYQRGHIRASFAGLYQSSGIGHRGGPERPAGLHDRRAPTQRAFPGSAAPSRQRAERHHVAADGHRSAFRPSNSDERPVAAEADQLFAIAHRAAPRHGDRCTQAAGRGRGPARRPRTRHRWIQGAERDRGRARRRPCGVFHRLRRDTGAWPAVPRHRRGAGEILRARGRTASRRAPPPSPSAIVRLAIRR